jgi:hypothetical protein
LNSIWSIEVRSGLITCRLKIGSVRASSSAMNSGLPSLIRMACEFRWRVEDQTMLPSGR